MYVKGANIRAVDDPSDEAAGNRGFNSDEDEIIEYTENDRSEDVEVVEDKASYKEEFEIKPLVRDYAERRGRNCMLKDDCILVGAPNQIESSE